MNEVKFIKNKKFKDLTTFRVGGGIKYYVEISSKNDIPKVVAYAKENKLPIFIVGGGSDILVSDKLFQGIVVKFIGKKIILKNENGTWLITSEAGAIWDDLVKFAVSKNLGGIECLSGIPGSVGAAPIQNIGAYGQELKETFVDLEAYDIEKEKFVTFDKEMCGFGYRESVFKLFENWQKYIITEITLSLIKDAPPLVLYDSLKNYLLENNIKKTTLQSVRDAVLAVRKSKFEDPKVVGNAGSFFKNPVIEKEHAKYLMENFPGIICRETADGKYKCFAGWLIENAGWKGKTYKNAAVSPRHALVIINPSNKATSKDILELAEKITEDVYKKFKITLTPEVQLINLD